MIGRCHDPVSNEPIMYVDIGSKAASRSALQSLVNNEAIHGVFVLKKVFRRSGWRSIYQKRRRRSTGSPVKSKLTDGDRGRHRNSQENEVRTRVPDRVVGKMAVASKHREWHVVLAPCKTRQKEHYDDGKLRELVNYRTSTTERHMALHRDFQLLHVYEEGLW